jgi:hypothetical protein
MQKKHLVKFISALSLLFITSCDRGDKYLGRLPVSYINGFSIDLYQGQEFDSSVGILYSIVDKNNDTLYGPKLLIGTTDFDREDTKDFTAGCNDSIIYLTFLDSDLVYAIYDIKSKHSINITNLTTRDISIENKLLKSNPSLRLSWNE